MSFSDHNLSIVRCRSRCCHILFTFSHYFFTFSSSFPEPLDQFYPNLVQSILGWRKFKSVQVSSSEGPCPFPRGDYYERVKIYLWNIKNFSRTTGPISTKLDTIKASLGEEHLSLFKWRATYSRGDDYKILKIAKIHWLQNHWTNFNQTLHKASLGEGNSNLFKWRARSFSKGR